MKDVTGSVIFGAYIELLYISNFILKLLYFCVISVIDRFSGALFPVSYIRSFRDINERHIHNNSV